MAQVPYIKDYVPETEAKILSETVYLGRLYQMALALFGPDQQELEDPILSSYQDVCYAIMEVLDGLDKMNRELDALSDIFCCSRVELSNKCTKV